MKTTDFIVEYAGIGDDAEAMGADHEVQLTRQNCYSVAKDAIALHHILKDVPEHENLENWIVDAIGDAAEQLKSVIEHLETLRHSEEPDLLDAFSFESAEAQLDAMLTEGEQVNELSTGTMDAYLKARKSTTTPGTLHKAVKQTQGVRSANEKIHSKEVTAKAKQTGRISDDNSRVREATNIGKVTHKPINLYKKDGGFLGTTKVHADKASAIAAAERTFKLPAGSVIAKFDRPVKEDDIEEGRFTKGPGGVPLDRRGNPIPPKEPKIKAPRTPAAPKLTLDAVWRKVEEVVGQIYPDGDPIDWMAPWLKRQGVEEFKVGEIIDRAARKHGYKDMYDYWKSFAEDTGYEADHFDPYGERMGESEQVDELDASTMKSYMAKSNKERQDATDKFARTGKFEPSVVDKMDKRAEFTMKAANKIAAKAPVTEDASAGGCSAGAIATGVAGAKPNKPGTGIPKELGNKVKRTKPTLGKGVY